MSFLSQRVQTQPVPPLGVGVGGTAGKEPVIGLLTGFSIETTPGIAEKIPSFTDLLPAGTSVYIAFLPGTDYGPVVATAARLRREGMNPVPHVAARSLASVAQLDDYIARLAGEAQVDQVLTIGGGVSRPVGSLDRTVQVLQSGVLERHGIRRIGVAGHPEGNPDIPDAEVRTALREKQDYARSTGVEMYIATQFCFDPNAIIRWDRGLRAEGIELPVHIGIAGPAKLKSLIDYARMCGIGASMRVLTRQAGNIAKLTKTSMPDRLIAALARYRANDPICGITRAHFFPFGGMGRTGRWLGQMLDGQFEMASNLDGFRFEGTF